MTIKNTRQARRARRNAEAIIDARLYGRLDAAIACYGWVDPMDDSAFFNANGHGGFTNDARVNSAYWRGWQERVAEHSSEVYIHDFR